MLSLEQMCLQILQRYREYIEDVGGMPMHLIDTVLESCSARDLLRIERATRAESGRSIAEELDKHWQKLFLEDFGLQVSVQRKAPSSSSMQEAGAWQQTYQAHLAELEEKKKRIGQKVRKMWEDERQKKNSRQIQVLDIVHRRGVKRSSPASRKQHLPGSRERLAKKLCINPVAWKGSTKKRLQVVHLDKAPVLHVVEHDINWGDTQCRKASSDQETSNRQRLPAGQFGSTPKNNC